MDDCAPLHAERRTVRWYCCLDCADWVQQRNRSMHTGRHVRTGLGRGVDWTAREWENACNSCKRN
jgi:hypothetical protein